MAALTGERLLVKRDGVRFDDPVAANAKIWKGALVVLNATGYAAPGTTATGLKARGVALRTVDNTGGADGDQRVQTEAGLVDFANSGTNAVTRAHIGGNAYIVDDQTVASTDGGGTRSLAGVIKDLDANGRVLVKVG